MKVIPEAILLKMSLEDRKALGQQTAGEAQAKYCQDSERRQQKLFAQWLTLVQFYYVQARADKRSTIRVGHPDFTIFHRGKTFFIEMKSPDGRFSLDQSLCLSVLKSQGFTVVIVVGAVEAIDATKKFFEL